MINKAVRASVCPELVTGTNGGRRQDEHVGVTVSTNGALFMLIYSAAFVLILNAWQQPSRTSTSRMSATSNMWPVRT